MAVTSPRLQAYLALERSMLDLDDLDDSLADKLRDAMDPVWYALTDEERSWVCAGNEETLARYKLALERIAEADDKACPHVKVALEALHP